MPKPPQTTPHSDIDGVHQDEESNVKTAMQAGQSAESLAEAQKHSSARPEHRDENGNKEDRTA